MRWWAVVVVKVRRRGEEVWEQRRSRRVSIVDDLAGDWVTEHEQDCQCSCVKLAGRCVRAIGLVCH